MHTVTSHKNDESKYVSYHQRNSIHTAVSAHPQAKPTIVRRNHKNFSPSKHVSASCLKSVGYTVLQERDTLVVNELAFLWMTLCSQSNFFVTVHGWAT